MFRSRFARMQGRTQILLLLGIIWVLIGLGRIIDPTPMMPGAFLLHELIPSWLLGVLWVVPGLIGMYGALRVPPIPGRVGFAGMVLAPTILAFSYLFSWIVHILPLGIEGFERGWNGSLIYIAITTLVYIESGRRDAIGDTVRLD